MRVSGRESSQFSSRYHIVENQRDTGDLTILIKRSINIYAKIVSIFGQEVLWICLY